MNIYDTRTMLAAVEMMKPVHTFLKSTFFPTPDTFTTEHVDVDYYKGRRKMAPFVSTSHAGKVMDREGFTTKTFKPAPIKPKRIITAADLNKRSMGENMYSAKSPDERAAELLARDLSDLDEAITRREEWMVAQVLFTGKVDIIGDGIKSTLEFDFTNKETLSGTSLWSSPDSDPIDYLKKKRREVIQKSGVNPNRIIMASDVVDAFVSHAKVKEKLDNRRIVLGQINPQTLPDGVTYIGSLSELGVDIYSYDEWYYDEESKKEKPMVPAGKVMIGSSNARSSLRYGAVTLTSPDGRFTTYEGTRIPDSWIKKDPDARFLQVHSLPLPVPHEVDSWYVATVL
ncbi:major capsid protein [Virgibacillus halodenitrificans]|uniref:major capsid protein n=1 Tax=Virgibacillus halodenitrificans TaxID=1482 RepID=UPI000EF48920|nr:major capsid protein [Virgibacillus halodenitrificans]